MIKIFRAACLFCLGPALAASQPAPPPQAVGYITAAQQPVYNESTYVGRIQSPQIVQLSARVTGYLEQQNFTDGDTVTKGQLLYVIEQPPYQAAVAQAQAALQQAQAQSGNANVTLSRARALLRTPAGQQSNVDTAAATAASDSAQIDSARAQLETAQINLGYTEIRSPIDGQIGATAVNVGNVVGPSTGTLATIVAQDPMYVVFALPVVDALKLRTAGQVNGGSAAQVTGGSAAPVTGGSAAPVTGGSGGLAGLDLLVQLPDGRPYGQIGAINFVNNQVTADTDTLTLRGTISNPLLPKSQVLAGATRELTDGEFITVILRARTPQQQIVVPRDAVITDQLGDYVLEVDNNNIVIRRPVTLGPQTNASVQITSGIKAGDRIITDGIQRIHPGETVTPKPAQSAQT